MNMTILYKLKLLNLALTLMPLDEDEMPMGADLSACCGSSNLIVYVHSRPKRTPRPILVILLIFIMKLTNVYNKRKHSKTEATQTPEE
jgi:hypothetical protein